MLCYLVVAESYCTKYGEYMSDLLKAVSQQLLIPNGLDIETLPSILSVAVGKGIDTADLYFQHAIIESWALEDGIVKQGTFNVDQGVGIRSQAMEKTGFAFSNTLTKEALIQAATAAKSIVNSGQTGRVQTLLKLPLVHFILLKTR